ncbi:hypothetical protein KCP74_13755 [Salmonella enterica subsp. enterica]|nr:hypothetical protein KCP74_13755 [Salmonella enterica subsp. enterica]
MSGKVHLTCALGGGHLGRLRHGEPGHVCIAHGFPFHAPLTLAAAENPFIHRTHFDERGLGHLALGLAKSANSRCRYCHFRYRRGEPLSGAD